MGRSRGAPISGQDDAHQRLKKRKAASSVETSEATDTGSGSNEGKKALYHCNYCYKDISGKIRIKCAKCPDFDLCVECFSVGAEIVPHKSIHPYRVMDDLSFPIICPDWNADEEILLLEGVEIYGMGNWVEVAEHVGTKSKAQCIDHFTTAYMNSPCYPFPDMSCTNGKNRKELLAMAKVQSGGEKGNYLLDDAKPKDKSPFSPSSVKINDMGESAYGQSPSSSSPGGVLANKKASKLGCLKDGPDGVKLEGLTSAKDTPPYSFIVEPRTTSPGPVRGINAPHVDRSVGVKKPKHSGDKRASVAELSGYNPKRREFDPEYDNDAEQLLADMEFKKNDSETDSQLKLRMLHIYLSRLDERKRRKDFILERNLLYPNPFEKELSTEDIELYKRYRVFMRFQSPEDHEALVKSVIEEHKIRQRIQELQESRAAGCCTLDRANTFIEQQKKKRESETIDQTSKGTVLESDVKDLSSATVGQLTRPLDEWEMTGLPGAELLSETEQLLCCQSRLFPGHYLKIQQVLAEEILKGNIVKKSDAHHLFKIDPSKIDRIYDVVKKNVDP